ncbi:MAG: DUF4349 domain-containing protein [Acidobacteria bacterium]|nr:DUF4349 domain-containing protein [Acidobacteriota bacterium]
MKRLAVLLALGLVIAACSAGDDSGAFGETALSGAATGTVPASIDDESFTEEAPANFDVRLDVVVDRKVIRQASLQLHASDTRATFDEIVRLTESVGGFVANANVFPFEGEDAQPDVSMTLRIPAGQLTSVMTTIKGSVDEVVAESQSAQDVTEQFVDLEARLRNLEALEVELRALLEDVRKQPDADPVKLLTVFNELFSVRGQIEQIQGQINYLSDLTAMATLDVQVSQTPIDVPIVASAWAPAEAAKDALRSLVTALQGIANWAISFALFTLPVLLLTLGIPATLGFFVYRRIKNRRGVGGPQTPAPAGS